MSAVNIIFPHQLFENSPVFENDFPVCLIEEFLFFNQYKFHKQKLAFHRASMKFYETHLKSKNKKVDYIDAAEKDSDVRQLIPSLAEKGIRKIHYIDPTDDWLKQRLQSSAKESGIHLKEYSSLLFINTPDDLSKFFKPQKKKFLQTEFYIQQRRKLNILLDDDKKPIGGKWSFDAENRKKYPKDKSAPSIQYPENDRFFSESKTYIKKHYPDNPGMIGEPLYPSNFKTAIDWLEQFLNERFDEFGTYEDAIVAEQAILNHSVLTPMLNTGLITPGKVIEQTLDFATRNKVPVNSVEGFIRQVIGWREFIRGIYELKGRKQRTENFWKFKRKIPKSFYTAETGIEPLDLTIKKVLDTGYCHHIERLMILGNFMLLCEFDPDEVYKWFMELFIDAYDWVMVPNVYGMSQFADGGLMSTKPYISGSNYLMKMSNFKKGPWQKTWDALFWRFMDTHRSFFSQNPRLGMLVKNFDRMAPEKRKELIRTAEDFLQNLESK